MRILWIEDMVDHIRRLASFLQRRGHEVVLNAAAEEALETLEQSYVEQRPFDVILLDLMLPRGVGSRVDQGARCERMGVEILRHMKGAGYRVPVVLTTAMGDLPATYKILDEYTFVSAILKTPVPFHEILSVIEQTTFNETSRRKSAE